MIEFLHRLKRKWAIRAAAVASWEDIRREWIRNSEVQVGRIGPRGAVTRPGYMLLRLVSSDHAEQELQAHLLDDDARVVAYCLKGLELLNSGVLRSIPDALRSRNEVIYMLNAGFVVETSLDSLVQFIDERHKEGKSLDAWASYGYTVRVEELEAHLRGVRELFQ